LFGKISSVKYDGGHATGGGRDEERSVTVGSRGVVKFWKGGGDYVRHFSRTLKVSIQKNRVIKAQQRKEEMERYRELNMDF